MLDQMRKQAHSTIILLLFGFIVFVFVFSFGSGSAGFRHGSCGSSNHVAIVNGELISNTDYTLVFRQIFENMKQRQFGMPQSMNQQQVSSRAVDQLIDRQLLIQAAHKLGLRVTDAERNEGIRSLAVFHDDNDEFDYDRYKKLVSGYFRIPMTKFEEIHREEMLANRMRDIIQSTVRVTDEELRENYKLRETKVDLEYVKLTPATYKASIKPKEEEIKQFAEKHADRLKSFYDENQNRYHKPKKMQIAHVYFRVEDDWGDDIVTDKKERAQLTLEDLDNGADFGKQCKEYSEDTKTKDKNGALGLMTQDTMAARWGDAFAKAAFELEEGKHSRVVRSTKGFHVIKCLKIIDPIDRKFEDVKQDIARELLINDLAEKKAESEAERLLAGLRAGKSLEDLTKNAKGDTSSPKINVSKTGLVASSSGYIFQLGRDQDLTRAAMALTKDNPIPDKVWKIESMPGSPTYVVFKLIDRQDPDMEAFEKEKSDLRDQLLATRRWSRVSEWLKAKRETASIEYNKRLLSVNPLRVQRRR